MKKDILKSYRELFPMLDMDDFGFSPIHEIILGIKHGGLKKAVMKWPAAIDQVDNEQRTPLMWASTRCNAAAVDILLRHGANPLAQQKNGATALSHAASGGSIECIQQLIKAGAKLQKGIFGMNAIHRTINVRDDVDLLATLLRLPGDINCKDEFSRSYLAHAALEE